MSIEKHVEVTLYCDGMCNGQEGRIEGTSVSEVKAQARAEGWRLTRNGDFCGCDGGQDQ